MSKKILVVAPYTFLPYRSGGQKSIAQFLEALGQQARVTVVSTAQEPGYTPSPHYKLLPILAYSFFRYADLTLKATLIDLIERNQYDWIIWEHPYFGWLAKIIKEKTGIKTLIHTHNIEYQRFRSLGKFWWPLLERYERDAFRMADKLSFVTAEDKKVAIDKWRIAPTKCLDVPFGITIDTYPADKSDCREQLLTKHQLPKDCTLLLFNGLLDYAPNYKALRGLLGDLIPRLQKKSNHRFILLVCGKGLPKRDKGLVAYKELNVHYAGFVEDIDCYFKGADIFLNPVTEGGGIKTKMIESIAMGTPVVSMRAAATGLDPQLAGKLLTLTDNQDWEQFAAEVVSLSERLHAEPLLTPTAYYAYYNWKAIIERLLNSLTY